MSKEKNSSLMEIRDILKEEMDKFNAINDEIIDNQHDFQKINDNYNKYNNLIDKGHSHVSDLRKQEFYENLFVYIGFYFFFFCVAIVLLRRFPVHKIIFFAFKMLHKFIMMFFPNKKGTVANIENDPFLNKTNDTFFNQTNDFIFNKTNETILNKTSDYILNKTEYSFLNKTNDTIVHETENSILDETDDDNDNDDNSILNKTDSSLNFTNDL